MNNVCVHVYMYMNYCVPANNGPSRYDLSCCLTCLHHVLCMHVYVHVMFEIVTLFTSRACMHAAVPGIR